jgi:hypothetical protein
MAEVFKRSARHVQLVVSATPYLGKEQVVVIDLRPGFAKEFNDGGRRRLGKIVERPPRTSGLYEWNPVRVTSRSSDALPGTETI